MYHHAIMRPSGDPFIGPDISYLSAVHPGFPISTLSMSLCAYLLLFFSLLRLLTYENACFSNHLPLFSQATKWMSQDKGQMWLLELKYSTQCAMSTFCSAIEHQFTLLEEIYVSTSPLYTIISVLKLNRTILWISQLCQSAQGLQYVVQLYDPIRGSTPLCRMCRSILRHRVDLT